MDPMDSDDLARRLGYDGVEGVYEAAIEQIANSVEKWQGDTPTDAAARAVLGCLRPLMEMLAREDAKEINRLVFTVLVKQYMTTLGHVQALDVMAKLRDDNGDNG